MRTRLVPLALGLVAILTFAGCQGFLADRKISSIDSNIREMQALDPDVHAPQRFADVQSRLETIKNVRQTDAASANQQAAELLETSEQLLEDLRVAAANAEFAEAQKSVEIMNLNNGRNVDQARYEAILQTFNEAQQSLSESDWIDARESAREVNTEVTQLLAPLKLEAERLWNELKQERTEMDRYDSEIYAPKYVTEVQQYIEDVREQIDQARNYLQASSLARTGKTVAQEGITRANSIRAQIEINKLEDRLAKAVDEGAEIYAPDKFNQATTTFDSIVQAYLNDEFQRVLSMIEILRPQVDQLIFLTLSRSTEEKLAQLRGVISRHREGGVEIYLPGRVERLEEKVQAAADDYDVTKRDPEEFPVLSQEEKQQIEDSFTNIKAQIQEAFILSEKIDAAFDDLTGTAIRDAEFALNVAKELFNRMEGAFMKQTPADATPLDPDFTSNKQALQTELGQRLNNSEVLLRQAKNDRANAQYRTGIETAQQVERTANYVQDQVYHVVADNAVLELENQITRFTNEGAQEFATEDLEETREILDETKQLMRDGQYREAVAQAAQVRAQLDVTLQVLGRATLDKIQTAQQAIGRSEELRANQFAPETVGRARNLVSRAQDALVAKSYRQAIQLAESALDTAEEAATEAGLAWSRAELETARQAQQLAEAAGAVAYAPLILRQAQNQYATARELRENAVYLAAATTAQEAARTFNEATFKLINDANEAILTNRRSEGWKYESDELTKAIVKAEQAMEALQSANYDRSHKLAQESRALAEEITEASQKAGIQERIARINRSVNQAERSGANYFQVSEVKRLLREAEKVKATARTRTYEDVIEELNRIEAEFEIVLASTDERVKQIVEQQRQKLVNYEETTNAQEIASQSISDARSYFNYAVIDFDEGNYPSAYKNLRQGLDAVEAVEIALAEHQYQIRLTKVFRKLSDSLANFDAVISVGPNVLKRMALGIQGRGQSLAIANAMPPTQFKQNIDDIYLEIISIKPPPTRRDVHRQAVRVITEARLAAAEFQKFLIFDELDPKSIRETVDNAYAHLDTMYDVRADMQQRLLTTGADLDVVPQRRSRNEGLLIQSGFNGL